MIRLIPLHTDRPGASSINEASLLPEFEVELCDDIVTMTSTHVIVDVAMDEIIECPKEACEPKKIVFLQSSFASMLSGQNLKAGWIGVDGIAYRLYLLNAEKTHFFLDQREQHALVGGLFGAYGGRWAADATEQLDSSGQVLSGDASEDVGRVEVEILVFEGGWIRAQVRKRAPGWLQPKSVFINWNFRSALKSRLLF